MSGYTHAPKITVTEEANRARPKGYRWRKAYAKRFGGSKQEWSIRSDAGAMAVRVDWCETLTEARKIARRLVRSGKSPWAEVFRWYESGVGVGKVLWCSYEHETVVE